MTTSLVPDSIIEVFILSIAAASAFETSSIALALPSAQVIEILLNLQHV